MKIGVLGLGDVGRRLGDGFIEHGQQLKLESRTTKRRSCNNGLANHRREESKCSSGTFAERLHLGNWLL